MDKKLLNKLKLWLAPMIGESSFYKILNFYKENLEEVFLEDKIFPLDLKISNNLKDFLISNRKTKILDKLLEKELKFLEKNIINIVDFESSEYPFLLKNIYNPPPILFVKGNIKTLSNKCIGIVGTRFPTEYGKNVAKSVAEDLARNNITIVSGLARGIDSQAHIGAIKYGNTIGVIGSGFKYQYPLENKKLYEEILKNEKSAIVSEFPFEKFPDKKNFPVRNRIISGLSSGIVVVEANKKSGSLITAMHALDQNRNIYSVPGEITNPKSNGTNKLIKDGAKIVLSTNDILDDIFEFDFSKMQKKETFLENNKQINFENKLEENIYNLISLKKLIQFDEIIESLENNITEIMDAIFNLLLNNLINEKPGKYYSIN